MPYYPPPPVVAARTLPPAPIALSAPDAVAACAVLDPLTVNTAIAELPLPLLLPAPCAVLLPPPPLVLSRVRAHAALGGGAGGTRYMDVPLAFVVACAPRSGAPASPSA